jgi:hypothetical protein
MLRAPLWRAADPLMKKPPSGGFFSCVADFPIAGESAPGPTPSTQILPDLRARAQRNSFINCVAMRWPFSPTSAAPAEVSTATTVLSPLPLTAMR